LIHEYVIKYVVIYDFSIYIILFYFSSNPHKKVLAANKLYDQHNDDNLS